jgi:hypothetical protein
MNTDKNDSKPARSNEIEFTIYQNEIILGLL